MLQDKAFIIFPEDANYNQQIAISSIAGVMDGVTGGAMMKVLGFSIFLALDAFRYLV